MRKKSFTHKKISTVLAALYLIANCSTVLAAAEVNAGTVLRDSKQTERKLTERQVPNITVEKEIKPPMVNDDNLKVVVKKFFISGQDIYTSQELIKLLTPYINKELGMTALQDAANLIAKYFRDQGYFVAQAYLPVQEITGGTVEIAVIVGRSGDIILKNQSVIPDSIIMKQLSAIKAGADIHTSTMERAALLVNDLPGVSAKTTLIPGKLPGKSDIIVEVKPKGTVWQGSISENNQGSRMTGYNQSTLNFTINNPVKKADSVNVNINKTNLGENTGSVAYHIPLSEGNTLNLSYSKVSYELGKEMSYLNAYGTAYTKHADWTYSLRRSRDSNQSIEIGYDYKTMQDKIDYSSSVTDKWAHMMSIGLLGDSNDSLWGGGANNYSLLWYNGNAGGNSNSATTVTTGKWQKLTYNVMRQQVLRERLSLLLAVNGQIASTNLDSSEKMSLGGANAVRAYPTGEASGDEAWLATTELRYTLPSKANSALWQLVAFYDIGASYNEKNPTQSVTANHRTLSGAGIGVNYILPSNYSIKATYAWRIGSEVAEADSTFGKGRLWLQGVKYF